MLTSSHTHCGPVIRSSLNDMYDMPPDEWKKVEAYTQRLQPALVEVIIAALDDLKPAKLSIGSGTARFAMNRREATPKGVVIGGMIPWSVMGCFLWWIAEAGYSSATLLVMRGGPSPSQRSRAGSLPFPFHGRGASKRSI